MYTWDNLTEQERAKIQPGLHDDMMRILAKYCNRTIRSLDSADLAAADTWIEVGSGSQIKYYWIRDTNIPTTWGACTDWVNFIVQLAKGPWVRKVGILREFPFTEWPVFPGLGAFINWEEVDTPSQLVRLAYQGSAPGAPPTHTLTVLVTDQNGSPINGAVVTIGQASYTTNSQGEAYFTLPGGDYVVSIRQTGFQPRTEAFTLDRDLTLRYTLIPKQPAPHDGGGDHGTATYTLNVYVFDTATHQPIYDAKVVAGSYSATTNGAGLAALSLPAGTYNVTATKNTYSKSVSVDITTSSKDVTIYLGPAKGGAGLVARVADTLHVSESTAIALLLGGGAALGWVLLRPKKH